jgi:hypothetical protein
MHPKMMATLSILSFTPSPLATAKIEPKSNVTNQSMVIDFPTIMNIIPKKLHTSTFKSLSQRVPPFFLEVAKGTDTDEAISSGNSLYVPIIIYTLMY